MSEVKGQGHILYQVSNQCVSLSFHTNRTNNSTLKKHIQFLKENLLK